MFAGVRRARERGRLPRHAGRRCAQAPGRDPGAPAPQGPAAPLAAGGRPGLPAGCSPAIDERLHPADAPRRRGRHPLRPGHRHPARQALGRLRGAGRPRPAAPRRALRRPRRSCARCSPPARTGRPFSALRARRARRETPGSWRPARRCTRSVRAGRDGGRHRPQLRPAAGLPRDAGPVAVQEGPGRRVRARRSWRPTRASWTWRRPEGALLRSDEVRARLRPRRLPRAATERCSSTTPSSSGRRSRP